MSETDELGTLIIVVLKARNLIDKHFYKQDVYCQISLNGEDQKTQADVKGGQHPVWDDEKRFKVLKTSNPKSRTLKVQCFSKEHRKADDDLGSGEIDIEETLKTGEFDDWVPLSLNGQQRGDVYLEMTVYSSGPAPAPAPAPAPVSKPAQMKESTLSVPNLARRPSKWKPSERLAQPDQTQHYAQMQLNANYRPAHGQTQLPPSSMPNSHRRTISDTLSPSSLPIPGALAPGRPKTSASQQVPSFLRPNTQRGGAPGARPVSQHPSNRQPSPDNMFFQQDTGTPNPYMTRDASSTPNPYINASHNRTESSTLAANQPSFPPMNPSGYGSDDQPLPNVSFPTPDIPAATSPNQPVFPPQSTFSPNQRNYTPSPQPPIQPPVFPTNPTYPTSVLPTTIPPTQYYTPPSNPTPSSEPQIPHNYPGRKSPEREKSLPDPYLQARYMTPLPLPPGAKKDEAERHRKEAEAKTRHEEEEKRKRQEEETKRKDEEERRRVEEDALRLKAEEEKRRHEEEERQRREDEERQKREDEERRQREEEERRKREHEEQRKREEEERQKREEEERRKREEEERQRREEEQRERVLQEERKRIERLRKIEEEARKRKEQAERDRAFAEQLRLAEEKREEEEKLRRAADEALIARLEQDRVAEEKEFARRRAQADADEEMARKLSQEIQEQEDRDMELAKRLDRELNLPT